jgi:hypothetical protein
VDASGTLYVARSQAVARYDIAGVQMDECSLGDAFGAWAIAASPSGGKVWLFSAYAKDGQVVTFDQPGGCTVTPFPPPWPVEGGLVETAIAQADRLIVAREMAIEVLDLQLTPQRTIPYDPGERGMCRISDMAVNCDTVEVLDRNCGRLARFSLADGTDLGSLPASTFAPAEVGNLATFLAWHGESRLVTGYTEGDASSLTAWRVDGL